MLYVITESPPRSTIVYGVQASYANHANVSGFIVPLEIPRYHPPLIEGATYSFIPSKTGYAKGHLDVSKNAICYR